MTIYREVTVTLEQRNELRELGTILTLTGNGRLAAAVQDIVERWDESVASESTFPLSLDRHIDDVAAGVI